MSRIKANSLSDIESIDSEEESSNTSSDLIEPSKHLSNAPFAQASAISSEEGSKVVLG